MLLAGVALVCVLWAMAPRVGAARRVLGSISGVVSGAGKQLAWAMALLATLGSLYFSEIAHFPPCEYCWYQRIAMYPLVLILGSAIITGERAVRRFALPLAIPGAVIAAYHYAIQRMPDLSIAECTFTVPCTTAFVWKFDLVSIPFMAFTSFAVIITVLLLDRGAPAATAHERRTNE